MILFQHETDMALLEKHLFMILVREIMLASCK